MLRKKAKENLAVVGGDMRDAKTLVNGPVNVRKEIAATAGVSEQKVYRYMKIVGAGALELIEQVKKGEVKIGTAYNMLRAESKTVRVFYDDADERDRQSPFGRTNVLIYIDSIGKLYRFVGEAVSAAGDMKDMDGVMRRLEAQLSVVERLV